MPVLGQPSNPTLEFPAWNGQRPVEEPDFWRLHHVFSMACESREVYFKTRPATFCRSQFRATSVVQSVLKPPPGRSLIEKALQQTAREVPFQIPAASHRGRLGERKRFKTRYRDAAGSQPIRRLSTTPVIIISNLPCVSIQLFFPTGNSGEQGKISRLYRSSRYLNGP